MSKIKELMELSRYLGQRSDRAYEAVMKSHRFLPRGSGSGTLSASAGVAFGLAVRVNNSDSAAGSREEEE